MKDSNLVYSLIKHGFSLLYFKAIVELYNHLDKADKFEETTVPKLGSSLTAQGQ